jgi:hypothetical protein
MPYQDPSNPEYFMFAIVLMMVVVVFGDIFKNRKRR